MSERSYKYFVCKQTELQKKVAELVKKWSVMTTINVKTIELIVFERDNVIVRFREEETLPNGNIHLHCARNLTLPARLLWSSNQDEDLRAEIISSIKIREATYADAEAISWVHWKAVHITVAKDGYYGQRILDDWSSPVNNERIDHYRKTLMHEGAYPRPTGLEHKVTIVAVLCRKVVGFGVLVPGKSYLNALYVSPEGSDMRVGTRMLQDLERRAIESGCEKLELHASMNAQSFYLKHGYHREKLLFHTLHTGLEMPCAWMSKTLQEKST